MEAKNEITLRNVSRVFTSASGEKVEALRDVNLEIADEFAPDGRDIGEFRVLLGPSGCGKSTILRMIAGLDFPTAGEIMVNGRQVTGPGPDRGMVFQKYTSFNWLTVARNVEYGLRIKGTPEAERREIVEHLIEAVGLAGFENAYPHTLSGGMQQRLAIARSLAVRPQVWVENGVLKQLYYDRFTAQEHNVEPTPYPGAPIMSLSGPTAKSIDDLIALGSLTVTVLTVCGQMIDRWMASDVALYPPSESVR